MDNGTVDAMVAFQRQGIGFETMWQDIQPIVEKAIRRELKNRLVRGYKSAEDDAAVDDTLQQVAWKLLQLPGKPGSWFYLNKGRGAGRVSALKGWLSTIASNEAVEYCRVWRGAGKSVKSIPLSQCELNGPLEARSALKPALLALRIDEATLSEVMNECIDSLQDEGLRRMVSLRLRENLSERSLAKRLDMNVTTVHRRLHDIYSLLRPLLVQRGIDGDWRLGMGLESVPQPASRRRGSGGRTPAAGGGDA